MEVLEGTERPDPVGDTGGPPAGVALFNPCGLAVSVDGHAVFVADTGHHRICVLTDGVLRVLAGSGARGYADGCGAEAMFAHPCGLAVSPQGTLFVADCGNHRIRAVTPDGKVSTVAGSGRAAHGDGRGVHASFYNPCGIAIDNLHDDILYVADYSNNCVRVVGRSGLVTTLATKGAGPLDAPYGIAVRTQVAPEGGTEATVFISSYHSHSVAAISPEGRVAALAGCGAARQADGQGGGAAFHAPNGLCVDAEGNLFVADSGNHAVRFVTPSGHVSTLAGTGSTGAAASSAALNSPCGLCLSILPGRGAVVLIADRANCCVRVLATDALPPHVLPPSTIGTDLRALLDDPSPAGLLSGEAVFVVQGKPLRAPKSVLCARCAHFRAMFGSGMRESLGGPVELPGVGYDVFRSLLHYLLTDDLTDELERAADAPDGLLELMVLANAYGERRLEAVCGMRLERRLDASNVDEVLRCATLISAPHLQLAAAKFQEALRLNSPSSPVHAEECA